MSRVEFILASALLAVPALLAQKPTPVDFELMTWPEVKQALADGKTTALIMNGGTEQRGPQGVNGAHTLIVRTLGVEIARKLGNAIVAPAIPFSPNRANPALPGTIGISTQVFAQLNAEVAEQMIANGFRNIELLGDHGGGQAQLDEVANALSGKYAGKGIRVVHCDDFYTRVGADFDKWLADNGYPAGSHASVKDTSELLYLGGDKGWVRRYLIATAVGDPVLKPGEARDPNAVRVNNGIEGDARRSTPEIGKKVSDMKVERRRSDPSAITVSLLSGTAPVASPVAGEAAPTNIRRAIVAFGAAIAFLSFLDRSAISQASPAISREMHLSPARMGLIFSAFGFTYAAFEMPSGWLCDRFGVRKLLTRIVLLWSLFTATTGAAWNFPSLFISRLLFGAGESGCFPGLASMFRTWLPPRERNSAEGIKAACARWGAAIAPALITALYAWFTWRQVFVLLGLLGAALGLAFALWYRDDPAAHSSVNAAEVALLPVRRPRRASHGDGATWTSIIRSRSIWALGLQWFAHYYGFYFYITWLPLYLYRVRGLDLRHGALAAGLPLFTAGLGSLFAGWATSTLTARVGSVDRARKLMGYISYGGAAALLLLFTWAKNPGFAMFAMSLSSFAAEFSGPISWTTAMDIGGENVGAVSGFMNTLGQLGASVAPAVTGFLLQLTGNGWNFTFYASALIYAAGAICWMAIDSTTPLDTSALREESASRTAG